MFILTAILITLLTPLVVLGLSFSRIRPGFLWLLALISTFFAWGLVLASRNQLPIFLPLTNWEPDFIFSTSPSLLIDDISWPFAVAMMTLPLAALVTDVSSLDELDPQTWASIQALGGAGLIAVIAGNPLTMLMAWAVIDITECVVLLLRTDGSRERERIVISFSARVAGMLMLILAVLRTSDVTPLSFGDISSDVTPYLILAAGLRLGVLPLYQPHLQEPQMRRGLGTLVRFVPIAASLVLLVRAGHVGVGGIWQLVFLVSSSFTVIFSSLIWVLVKNELQGRSYWILGLSSFALIASVQKLPVASASWGLAMLFSGALLFLFSMRNRWLSILFVFGAVGFSALPLTPAWEGGALFFALPLGYRIIFFTALALLILGYLRHANQSSLVGQRTERWIWIIYPIGLVLLLFTHYGLIFTKWILGYREISIQTPGWWSGTIPLVMSGIFLFVSRRRSPSAPKDFGQAENFFDWVFGFFWWVYRSFSRIMYIVTRLLEGQGSVLWALLILLMLIVTMNIWGSTDGLEF